MSMMPVKHLGIAVIGDEELISGLRLAGVSKYFRIEGDGGVREDVRKALTELIAEPDIGVVVILEDYAQYVQDLLIEVREKKGRTPVVIEVPSKFGTKYPDIVAYYKAFVRESIGFDIEI
jgi:vacuolar-type H+-ATPase subunit F/Vma7